MPSRTTAAALAAVAAPGRATGCEKQSPYVTLTAHGVTVKARATKYCRAGRCTASTGAPSITVTSGDTLGIDVPRSLADQGWQLEGEQTFSHEHYRSLPITERLQPGGTVPLKIVRDDRYGAGEWLFTVHVK
jgi:hypothetical protein